MLSSELINENIKGAARHLFSSAFPQISKVNSIRGKAYALQGLCYYSKIDYSEAVKKTIEKLADEISGQYEEAKDENWHWFENTITYANARIPLSLFLASELLNKENYKKIAIESLQFIKDITIIDNRFVPIGNKNWYKKKGKRAYYDQQPIEACCMIELLITAYKILKDEKYYRAALVTFDWFLGRNIKGESLYDPVTGGCYDGLSPAGINMNQGAESTLSYLLARLDLETINVE